MSRHVKNFHQNLGYNKTKLYSTNHNGQDSPTEIRQHRSDQSTLISRFDKYVCSRLQNREQK